MGFGVHGNMVGQVDRSRVRQCKDACVQKCVPTFLYITVVHGYIQRVCITASPHVYMRASERPYMSSLSMPIMNRSASVYRCLGTWAHPSIVAQLRSCLHGGGNGSVANRFMAT